MKSFAPGIARNPAREYPVCTGVGETPATSDGRPVRGSAPGPVIALYAFCAAVP